MEAEFRKGSLTRQRIIEKAAPVFNKRGFDGASMQEIMEACNLEKGGIYRHFSSKEEIAAEAFRYAFGRAVEARILGMDMVEGAIPKLLFMVGNFIEKPSSIPGGCPLLNTAIDADDGNSTLRGLAEAGLHRWRRSICRIVKDGRQKAEIRSDVDPLQVANTIIGALEGALMISRLDGDRSALRAVGASLGQWLTCLAPPLPND